MQRVNFFGHKEKGLNYQQMILLSGLVVVFILVLGLWQSQGEKALTQKFSQVDQELKTYQQTYGSGGFKKDQQFLWDVSGELFREPKWNSVLVSIANALPDGIWLEALEGHYDKQDKAIIIQGTAFQPRLVPKLLKRLNSYSIFKRVKLILTEVSGNVDAPFRFKIKAIL